MDIPDIPSPYSDCDGGMGDDPALDHMMLALALAFLRYVP